MKQTTYFAVFEPSETGYGAYFPDLPGCITVGDNIEQTRKNAEEALGLHLWGLEKEDDEIPAPTLPPYEDVEGDCFVMPITVYMDLVRSEMDNKSIKKTLTIPFWLNEIAEQEGVNFSQVLQGALKDYLDIK